MRPCPSFMSLRLSLPRRPRSPRQGAPGRRAPPPPPGPENTGDKELDALRAQAEAAGPKFPPRRLPSSPGPGDSSHSGAPPPACLIPPAAAAGGSAPAAAYPAEPARPLSSPRSPGTGQEGPPVSPHLPQLHPDAQQVRPLHGYLSRQPCLPGPEDPGLLPAGGQPQAGQAVGLPCSQRRRQDRTRRR